MWGPMHTGFSQSSLLYYWIISLLPCLLDRCWCLFIFRMCYVVWHLIFAWSVNHFVLTFYASFDGRYQLVLPFDVLAGLRIMFTDFWFISSIEFDTSFFEARPTLVYNSAEFIESSYRDFSELCNISHTYSVRFKLSDRGSQWRMSSHIERMNIYDTETWNTWVYRMQCVYDTRE